MQGVPPVMLICRTQVNPKIPSWASLILYSDVTQTILTMTYFLTKDTEDKKDWIHWIFHTDFYLGSAYE